MIPDEVREAATSRSNVARRFRRVRPSNRLGPVWEESEVTAAVSGRSRRSPSKSETESLDLFHPSHDLFQDEHELTVGLTDRVGRQRRPRG